NQEEAVRQHQPAQKQRREQQHFQRVEHPAHLDERRDHDATAEEEVRHRGPVDVSAADKELLVDRPQQDEVEVAGANELAELGTVIQEESLDQPLQSEVAAKEKEILRLLPAGDTLRLAEDGAVEHQQNAQPQQLDDDLDEKVGAESHFAGESIAAQGEEQSEV